MASLSFQLEAHRHPLLQLLLFVVEEPVELSLQFSCNHCRYIGWGNHMICNKNYHFLLPSKSGSDEYAKTSVIELQRENHSFHGVLHSNGFGHLLCINGSENGSGLPGYQIMELWDRLCSGLGAREVSLRDEAKKKSLEMYQNAIKTIQSIPLNLIAHQFGFGDQIQVIFSKYQLISGNSLSTLGDLFRFMLELKTRVPKESSSSYPAIMPDASCRWSPKRVEKAIHVVVEALKRAEFQWVSRQHVRDVARAYIGDTGLLDFVLKSLGNHMVGKYLVRRCLNPVTKVLEYCLEDVSRTFSKQEVLPLGEAKYRPHHKVSWAQLIKDLLYMYNNILVDHNLITKNGAFGTIPLASRIILDAKHLAKDYHGEPTVVNDETNRRKIYCKVILKQNISEEATSSTARTTPYHCFLMRNNAMFDELRFEVEKTFGETYFPLRNMAADSIRNMSPQGSEAIFKTVRPGTKLVFLCTQVGSEQGSDSEAMVVNCICGTKDDDGERMVSCDLCRVWQHTRCVHVPDHHAVPEIFLCSGCEQDILRIRCYATATPI